MWTRVRILGLTKAVVQTGLHPTIWKHEGVAAMLKPGKEDFTDVKSYGMISLLSCTGNVVETVLAELLTNEATRRLLLSDGKFGSRKKLSAVYEAAIIVDRAHSVWKEDNITRVLLLHVNAAFACVARGTHVHAMKAKQINGDILRWTASCLSDRTVKMVLKCNVCQSHRMEASVPQSSPMSPILFAIHTTVLIKWVEVKVS
jgi:hypothetical protein